MASISEELVGTTIRIEAEFEDSAGEGTGFFFNFKVDGDLVTCVITNRHVIEGAFEVAVHISHARPDGTQDVGQHTRLVIKPFFYVGHPDPDCDLALFPIAGLTEHLNNNGIRPYMMGFDEGTLVKPGDVFEPIEDILMIGYPTGIWDSKHNRPIVRRGITATDLRLDYNGRAIFMVDMACFPGSSGSPIVLDRIHLRIGPVIDGVRLLGVLVSEPHYTVEGQIVVEDIPTALVDIPVTRIPTHLGFVIKSQRILEFVPELEKLLAAEKARES